MEKHCTALVTELTDLGVGFTLLTDELTPAAGETVRLEIPADVNVGDEISVTFTKTQG